MNLKIKNRIGEVGENNFGTPMKIVDYKNCENIVVEFAPHMLISKEDK